MIKVENTRLKNVLLIKPDCFEDHRGTYVEIYNEELYSQSGVDARFIQDDISVSTRHVLRGIHGDSETVKLISCLSGKFYLVVLDADPESSSFGAWQAFVLSETNRHQVLVPPKYGNGHLVLSGSAIFHYKQTSNYQPEKQFTILWNDPRFNIWWPVKSPILSQRDELGRFV